MQSSPLVSVGLPVYNGERYITHAIESVLSQTYDRIELIISDNASDDRTQEIACIYAEQDPRVRYVRQASNLGAARNFNHVFRLAQGEFFKWLAADEGVEPQFVELCVNSLNYNAEAVLACTQYVIISESGDNELYTCDNSLTANAAADRFCKLIRDYKINVLPIWGLIRRAALQRTRLLLPYVRSDYWLMTELALLGPWVQSPEHLTHLRTHAKAYHRIKDARGGVEGQAEARWFDMQNHARIVLPSWRRLREYTTIALRSEESTAEKARMIRYLYGPFLFHESKGMVKELLYNTGLGFLYKSVKYIYKSVFHGDNIHHGSSGHTCI